MRRPLCLVLLAAAAASVAGCSRSQSEPVRVGATLRDYLLAIDERDGAAACALLTPDARARLHRTPGGDCAAAVMRLGTTGLAAGPQVSELRIEGKTATATLRTADGRTDARLRRTEGQWQLADPVLPARLGERLVARVGSAPITKAEFDHWLAVAAAESPGPGGTPAVPRPGTPRYRRLSRDVMTLLIARLWLEGEAAAQGITVSDEDVRRRYERDKRESFAGETDYRRFLRQTRQTDEDIRLRIRDDLLSIRIADRVVADADGPAAEQRVLDRFVRAFEKRWRARTLCTADYVMSDCSNRRGSSSRGS